MSCRASGTTTICTWSPRASPPGTDAKSEGRPRVGFAVEQEGRRPDSLEHRDRVEVHLLNPEAPASLIQKSIAQPHERPQGSSAYVCRSTAGFRPHRAGGLCAHSSKRLRNSSAPPTTPSSCCHSTAYRGAAGPSRAQKGAWFRFPPEAGITPI